MVILTAAPEHPLSFSSVHELFIHIVSSSGVRTWASASARILFLSYLKDRASRLGWTGSIIVADQYSTANYLVPSLMIFVYGVTMSKGRNISLYGAAGLCGASVVKARRSLGLEALDCQCWQTEQNLQYTHAS